LEISLNTKIIEMRDMFMLFDNPMDKYTQIIALGKQNPGIPDSKKNETNRIWGCASMAWVITEKKNHRFKVLTDSDTFIVKGLLNIIKFIVDGQTKNEILKLSLEDILDNIGLEKSITSQRTNGLINALKKIKEQVSSYDKS